MKIQNKKTKSKTKKYRGGNENNLTRVVNKNYNFTINQIIINIPYPVPLQGFFSGPWKYNKPYLKGRMVFIDTLGRYIGRYIGTWIEGKPNDLGMYTFKNRTTYIGQFKDGLFEGNGKLKYFNGDEYKGQFFQGVKQGYGQYISTDGSIYKGQYYNNAKNGEGTLTTNTQEYSGLWRDNEPYGDGKMTFFKTGVFINGLFQYVPVNGVGTEVLKIDGIATYPDGSTFEGIFMDYIKNTGVANPNNQSSLANNPLYDIKDGFEGTEPRNITDTEFI
jgi:hypothetical protein